MKLETLQRSSVRLLCFLKPTQQLQRLFMMTTTTATTTTKDEGEGEAGVWQRRRIKTMTMNQDDNDEKKMHAGELKWWEMVFVWMLPIGC
jgi:hypothetical protein